MATVTPSVTLPTALWQAVHALAPQDGNPNTVILRALEEYVTATHKRRTHQRPGKYQQLVKTLSLPVTDLHLSARPLKALRTLNIRYVYELVQQSPTDLRILRNFGEKSFWEVRETLAALGLTLGMTLEGDTYRAAVLAAVVANIQDTET